MNTLRNSLKENYSQIPNEIITDMSISAGALRVLLYLFTKPDSWNVYNKDIQKQLGISDKTLAKYWKELLSSKWLRREKRPPSEGNLSGGYIYQIGSFVISEESSEKEESSDHSNIKPIKKEVTYSGFLNAFNRLAEDHDLTKILKITDKRRTHLKARLASNKDFASDFIACANAIAKTPFLKGVNDRGWKVDFDWLVANDNNYVKILEGKYKTDSSDRVEENLDKEIKS